MKIESIVMICTVLIIITAITISYFGFTKYEYVSFQLSESRSSVLKVNRFNDKEAYFLVWRNWLPINNIEPEPSSNPASKYYSPNQDGSSIRDLINKKIKEAEGRKEEPEVKKEEDLKLLQGKPDKTFEELFGEK